MSEVDLVEPELERIRTIPRINKSGYLQCAGGAQATRMRSKLADLSHDSVIAINTSRTVKLGQKQP
jgi:hypothetical protein